MQLRLVVLALVAAVAAGTAALPSTPRAGNGPGVLYLLLRRDGGQSIYRVNVDGTGLERLPVRPDGDSDLYVAANGSAIAFDSGGRLHFASVDGSPLGATGATDYLDAWAPDGTEFAYTPGDITTTIVASPRSGRLARIPLGGDADAWSPDGKLLALSSDQYTGATRGPGIYVASSDGSQVRPLAVGGVFRNEDATVVAWSPDGAELAVVTTYGADDKQHLYVLPAAGGAPRRLTASIEKDVSLAWSPDGSQLAFASARRGRPSEIYVIRRDGTGEHAVTRSTGGESSTRPQWTADGSAIAYIRGWFSRNDDAADDVYVVRPDGSSMRPLLPTVRFGAASEVVASPGAALPATPVAPDRVVAVPPRFTLTTRGVGAVAASPTAAAVDEAPPGSFRDSACGPVVLWHPALHRKARGGLACNTAVDLLDSLALVGSTPVWRWSQWDHSAGVDYPTSECVLRWGHASRPAEPGWADSGHCTIGPAWAARHGVVLLRQPRGDVSQLVSDGRTAFLNTAKVSCVNDALGARAIDEIANEDRWCAHAHRPRVRSSQLWRLDGSRFVPLHTHTQLLSLDAASGGLVAGRETEHRVAVIRVSDGHVLERHETGADVTAVRLADGRLAVQAGRTLVVYGSRRRSYALQTEAGTARLLSLAGSLVAYASGADLHLLRLSDGRDVILDLPGAAGPIAAVFVPGGLYEGYNVRHVRTPGRVSFVPAATIARAFR